MCRAVLMLLMLTLPVLAQDVTPKQSGTRPAGVPPIVITPMASEVGDQIEVLGTRYQIVEMEFVRYDTDEPYIIKFPAINRPATELILGQQQATVTTQWVDDSQAELIALPEQVQVSGFPAGAAESSGSFHAFLKIVLNGSPPGNLQFSYGPSLALSIAIGPETIANIAFSSIDALSEATTLDNLVDVIPLFDIIPLRDVRIMQIEQLRTLLNYVEVRAKDAQP